MYSNGCMKGIEEVVDYFIVLLIKNVRRVTVPELGRHNGTKTLIEMYKIRP